MVAGDLYTVSPIALYRIHLVN